ncbi:acyl-CoA thioesterase [Allohahella sp. A8]|uniref:acyl-CoA thioesterase n=1 Tax=Allohahella sp. A8 TaxID=3141461 RepID=UPI000C0AB28E|nr:thioesterase [Hahellaceae bacterium]
MTAHVPSRADYTCFHSITTRWMDNDVYGHVNNVTYYSYFDTAVNHYLIHSGGLDIKAGPVIAYVVDSKCSYRQSIAYPDEIEVGLRVARLGNSSVEYELAIFRKGEAAACACGSFVHVFVSRSDEKAVSIPETIRRALQQLIRQ